MGPMLEFKSLEKQEQWSGVLHTPQFNRRSTALKLD
jgi:L,D-peptidoglycan transpeptidase YkuD (ErfK/YbiS/YcfS/YnhG family)